MSQMWDTGPMLQRFTNQFIFRFLLEHFISALSRSMVTFKV